MSTQPKQETNRFYHRNGVLEMEETFRGQKLHGRRRTWHRNGQTATEEFYLDGFLHGIVRQWNEDGKLLGSYEVQHGTGLQKKVGHDNGKLRHEFSTVGGEFCGRDRLWLQDGTLLSDVIYLHMVSQSQSPNIAKAMAKDPSLPKLRGGDFVKMPRETRASKKHISGCFCPRRFLAKTQLQCRSH